MIPVAFNVNICFTGAPASGLEELTVTLHRIVEVATSCSIPLFDQTLWLDPDSIFLASPERTKKLLSVADALLGAHGMGEEEGFYLLRGPLDVIALARMQGIALQSEFSSMCSRLLDRARLVLFQLPDPDVWRWKGFDQKRITWFMNYTKTLFGILREHGLRLEQFRVLTPQRGDGNANLVEAGWRLFGIVPNPLKPTQSIKARASVTRGYESQSRELFEGRPGSLFGTPHLG